MADVITYASSTSTTYKNGTIITGVDKLGNVQAVDAEIEHNVVVPQSGILDTRFDNPTFYSA